MTKGPIACVIDDDMVEAVKSGKQTGRAVADLFVIRALRRFSPHVKLVAAVDRDTRTIEELMHLKPSIVFNLVFSALPSEPSFAGVLEILGIPYTGSGPLGIGLANDKVRSRRLLASAGIRVPQFVEISPTRRPAKIDFAPPLIVKPVLSGNSVGIHAGSVVDSYARALKRADRIWRELEQPALCDEFIAGREFHVGLVERARGVFRAFPVMV
jgi:D-alanine-D-alanine ligase